MEIRDALEFVSSHHRGVLATRRRDGEPALTLVAAGVDLDGRVVISSREGAMKVANLRRDPAATLLVMQDAFFGSWVQIEGPASVVSLPDALEPLVEYYRSVAGEHKDWDQYSAAMIAEKRVLIRIAPTRAGPDRSG